MTVGPKNRIINLSSNENPLGPSPRVIKAIKNHSSLIHRYPESTSFELRQELARLQGLGPDNYIFGAGSNEVIDIILQTILKPKDKVLMPFPTFPQYKLLAEKLGGAVEEVPLNKDFSFDVDNFLSGADNAKIIFLCAPNNPTCSDISRKDVLKILRESACVVVDEAYVEFSGETVVDLVKKHENLLILRTFSKAYGLAGMRIGYGVAGRDLVEKMMKVKNPFNVNSLAQKSALAALSDTNHLKNVVETIVLGRKYLSNKLRAFFTVYPSRTNFLWVDVSPLSAYDLAQKLLKQNIAIRPFGKIPGYEGNYVRITVGTEEENEQLADALEALFHRNV